MSRADVDRIDEEHVRKVAADNPDLLHTRLAQRFGISVSRLRKIIGASAGELLNPRMLALAHYTPRPGASRTGNARWLSWQGKKDHVRQQLRAQENEKRPSWNQEFKPARRPNGRGGP